MAGNEATLDREATDGARKELITQSVPKAEDAHKQLDVVARSQSDAHNLKWGVEPGPTAFRQKYVDGVSRFSEESRMLAERLEALEKTMDTIASEMENTDMSDAEAAEAINQRFRNNSGGTEQPASPSSPAQANPYH